MKRAAQLRRPVVGGKILLALEELIAQKAFERAHQRGANRLQVGGAGELAGGAEADVKIRLAFLDAKLNYHPGNQGVIFQLFDSNAALVATAEASNGKRIRTGPLEPGDYTFRLSGSLTQAIDFVINSCQASSE